MKTVYILQIKSGLKFKDGKNAGKLYVKNRDCFGLRYTSDINKARLYYSKTSALVSANNGFSLKRANGQNNYNVIKVNLDIK